MDLHIEHRNVAMRTRWKTEIEARMEDLQAGHDDITHARVTLTKNQHHKKLATVAEALVVVTIPRRHLFSSRKQAKTFEEAIRAAFAAVEIEIDKFREKRRGARAARTEPVPPMRGVVSKLFPRGGYGFILKDGGGEVYFHKHAVQKIAFEDLDDGTEVAFNVENGKKGLQATAVTPAPALK
jgi:cold shock CspA family protein/ribosome-associated translation inhibitor RaiA